MTKSEIAALSSIPKAVVEWHGFGKFIVRGAIVPLETGWLAYVNPQTKAVAGVARTSGPSSKLMMATMATFAEQNGWVAYRIEA